MRVVVDYDVDRLQVYNGDIKPSSTNCPNLFLKRINFPKNLEYLEPLEYLEKKESKQISVSKCSCE